MAPVLSMTTPKGRPRCSREVGHAPPAGRSRMATASVSSRAAGNWRCSGQPAPAFPGRRWRSWWPRSSPAAPCRAAPRCGLGHRRAWCSRRPAPVGGCRSRSQRRRPTGPARRRGVRDRAGAVGAACGGASPWLAASLRQPGPAAAGPVVRGPACRQLGARQLEQQAPRASDSRMASRPTLANGRPPRFSTSKALPCSTMRTKASRGASASSSARRCSKVVAGQRRLVDHRVRQAACAELARFVDRGHEVEHQAHGAQRLAHQAAHLAPRRQRQHMVAGQRLRVDGRCGSACVHASSAGSGASVSGNSSVSAVLPCVSRRHTSSPSAAAVCCSRRQDMVSSAAPSLPSSGVAAVTDFVGRLVAEADAQLRLRRPAGDVQLEVDARAGMLEAPVQHGLQQREAAGSRRCAPRPAPAVAAARCRGRRISRPAGARPRAAAPSGRAARATTGTRPEARRVTCWPMMAARRARSISSRRARRLARSMRPVAASAVTRSAALDSARGHFAAELCDQGLAGRTGSASGGWPAGRTCRVRRDPRCISPKRRPGTALSACARPGGGHRRPVAAELGLDGHAAATPRAGGAASACWRLLHAAGWRAARRR